MSSPQAAKLQAEQLDIVAVCRLTKAEFRHVVSSCIHTGGKKGYCRLKHNPTQAGPAKANVTVRHHI